VTAISYAVMANKGKHLTLSDKVKILNFNESKKRSACKLAEKFSIRRTQTTDLICNKEKIYRQWTINGNDERKHLKV